MSSVYPKENKMFIYALTDADAPFYVGKSKNPTKRGKRHTYDATRLDYPVHRKIRKLTREGRSFDITIIEADIDEGKINDKERYWIAKYRKKFKLFNVTEGGEGGQITKEGIEKIRQAHLGKKRSKETRSKISAGKKGVKFSDSHKAKLSQARKKRVIKPETIEKMRKSSLGKINIKEYILTDPQGNEHLTTNGLTDFCRKHDLTPANLNHVLNGKRQHHKGWIIRKTSVTL